jgi:hypothetical protein
MPAPVREMSGRSSAAAIPKHDCDTGEFQHLRKLINRCMGLLGQHTPLRLRI